MDFRNYIKSHKENKRVISEMETNAEQPSDPGIFSDDDYFLIVNPDTGLKFDIPMLSTIDPGYFFKYIDFMKLRARSPETFAKILNWD